MMPPFLRLVLAEVFVKNTSRTVLRPRVKVWIEADERHVFCSGMCEILQRVAETGSIKAAAARVGLSYRHVWARLKEVEAALGMPLVESQVGGGTARRSNLSPAGQALLDGFLQLRRRLTAVSDECAAELNAQLRALVRTPAPQRPRS